ncbi:MAG: hypothetical protein ABIP94_23925 [Planctomycetota bacterium]
MQLRLLALVCVLTLGTIYGAQQPAASVWRYEPASESTAHFTIAPRYELFVVGAFQQ